MFVIPNDLNGVLRLICGASVRRLSVWQARGLCKTHLKNAVFCPSRNLTVGYR